MKPSNNSDNSDLEPLRQAINEADRKILALVNERLGIARKIGEIKQGRGMPVVDFSPRAGGAEHFAGSERRTHA